MTASTIGEAARELREALERRGFIAEPLTVDQVAELRRLLAELREVLAAGGRERCA